MQAFSGSPTAPGWTRPHLKRVCALLLGGALLSLSSAATAQWKPNPSPNKPTDAQVEEAKSRYKQGLRLYQEEGQVEAALIELQRSYDVAPNYKVLFNIGQVARSLPDYVTSIRAFERYLADGGKEIPASRKAEVEKELAELRDRVATITITTNLEGATISIDDIAVGKGPTTEAIVVNAGKRKITVTKDNLVSTKVVTIAGRDTLKIDLPIETPKEPVAPPPVATAPPPSTTPPPPPPPPPPPEVEKKPSYLWAGWAASGAFALGTGITGGLALAASSDLKNARYVGAQTPQNVTDLENKTKTMAIVADVLAGATVVALGVTLVFTLTSKPSEEAAPASKPAAGAKPGATARATRRAPASTMTFRAGTGGVSLGGTF